MYSVNYIVGVDSFCIGTACLKHTGFEALVDSGSSFTFLPADMYEKVTVEVFSLSCDINERFSFLCLKSEFYLTW